MKVRLYTLPASHPGMAAKRMLEHKGISYTRVDMLPGLSRYIVRALRFDAGTVPAMVIDGRERWACRTRLAALGAGPVTVRPLYHFPLLRDLVVDMAPFVDRMRAAGAAFAPRPAALPYAEVPSTSPERRDIDPAIECIGCGMCVSACTIVAHNARFPGPAALNRLFTLQRDSRDGAAGARWSVLMSDDALARCHGQGNCTEVCPMGLAPTTSILALRRLAVRRLFGGR